MSCIQMEQKTYYLSLKSQVGENIQLLYLYVGG